MRNGLRALAEAGTWDLVGVHDGARPLVTCGEIGGWSAALDADPPWTERCWPSPAPTPSRSSTRTAHHGHARAAVRLAGADPQIFRWQALMAAYAQPDEVLLAATDDASLVEARGGRVAVVEGSPENFKITDRARSAPRRADPGGAQER